MSNYQKIMKLVLEGRSYNEIVEAVGCSHKMRDLLGLNRPLGAQYVSFFHNTLTGNLGTSYVNGESVSNDVLLSLNPPVGC